MNADELINDWKAEERIAHIHGWDFSHIRDRYTEEENLPWDYRETILQYLKPEMRLLDIDTGGGEFLLSLNHPHKNTAATEGYPPNVELCRRTLLPLGIDFRPGDGTEKMPFDDDSFDMVINRHGDFIPSDIYRLLKPGGIFITQQVGAENDRELVELLCGETELPFPEQYLDITSWKFQDAGFEILEAKECFRPIRFYDVGALVWFARIIEWEFPGFSVDTCRDRLLNAQRIFWSRTAVLRGESTDSCWWQESKMNRCKQRKGSEGGAAMDNDILFFFGEHMDALPIYERLENAILTRIPDVKIKVAKTQITFAGRRGFAFVSFNPCRKAKDRPAVWVTISFGLGYRKESPRIDVATEPYPGRWTHHVMVGTPDEIDEELLGWIQEAADFSASKR